MLEGMPRETLLQITLKYLLSRQQTTVMYVKIYKN